jgi:DNA-binding transcriptional LysR family regulator
MTDHLSLFRTFVRVVEAGSFTAVAAEQSTSQPTISRRVGALEAHLGALLLHRTTRALTLTDDGRAFFERARAALASVAEAETSVGKRKGKPTGSLRIAAAGVLARLHLMPRLGRFLERFPEVEVDLAINDDTTDLVGEGVDLAVRVGELVDRNLVARRIGTTRRVIVATPAYLARHGEPTRPEDLGRHNCILYTRLATGGHWPLLGPGGPILAPVWGRLRLNGTEAVRAAILSGYGIGMTPIWQFADREIETGKLVRVLRDHEPIPLPIHAVYASRRFVAAKVREMVDFLAEEFAQDPLLSSRGVETE